MDRKLIKQQKNNCKNFRINKSKSVRAKSYKVRKDKHKTDKITMCRVKKEKNNESIHHLNFSLIPNPKNKITKMTILLDK